MWIRHDASKCSLVPSIDVRYLSKLSERRGVVVVHSPRSPGSLSLHHWDPFKKTSGPRSLLKKVLWPHDWRVGNFGDLFARDLAEFLFPETRIVSDAEDRRLLIVGSIASSARSRDVLAGVGFRNKEKYSLPLDTYVWALRGPLSLDLMNKSSRRDIEPRFLADPGLLASTVWERKEGAKAEGWIVIPPLSRPRAVSKTSGTPERNRAGFAGRRATVHSSKNCTKPRGH